MKQQVCYTRQCAVTAVQDGSAWLVEAVFRPKQKPISHSAIKWIDISQNYYLLYLDIIFSMYVGGIATTYTQTRLMAFKNSTQK